MSKHKQRIRIILVAIIALSNVSACKDECANSIIQSSPSPDGQHQAVLFERSCGATTGFSTQVSLLSEGELLDGAESIFSADDNHGSARTENWGGPWAKLEWKSNNTLIVFYDTNARVFKTEESKIGITTQFVAVNR
ncbi:MAG: hypothetical protein ACEQSU_05940 [Microgenomates group bacterium]